jgi:hypothetical protein
VLEEIQRFPAPLGRILAEDLSVGELTPETVSGLVAHVAEPIGLFQDLRVSDGIVRLGATLRVPADLSDPILTVGPEGYPPGLAREYYAFIEGNLDKLPVVLDDAAALKLARSDLPVYWRSLMVRSRADAPLLRAELFKEGRIVSHRALDYRSPVFAVAQVAYSRAVTGIAATWLAVWREARGDMTRMRAPVEVRPVDPSEAGGTP